MNPMVQRQLQRIEAAIRDVSRSLNAFEERIELRQQDFETLRKTSWSQRKQITALERASQEFDSISARNEHLEDLHSILRERLRTILKEVKSLGGEYRT